jgi:hypothetical protein
MPVSLLNTKKEEEPVKLIRHCPGAGNGTGVPESTGYKVEYVARPGAFSLTPEFRITALGARDSRELPVLYIEKLGETRSCNTDFIHFCLFATTFGALIFSGIHFFLHFTFVSQFYALSLITFIISCLVIQEGTQPSSVILLCTCKLLDLDLDLNLNLNLHLASFSSLLPVAS